jgi:hypothetical protein
MTRKIGRGAGHAGRPSRTKLILVTVTVIPVLLIGYSLCASLLAPDTDMSLVLSACLISGVGGFVVWDTLFSRPRPAAAFRPVRISRSPRGGRR